MSGSITHAIGDHGIYAIFGLLIVAAVLPVASELVMLYGGALAGGAFAGASVHVFGTDVHSHVWGYVAVAIAGTLGNLAGAAIGWCIGRAGVRFFHVTEAKLARAEQRFERFDDWAVPIGLATPLARSFVAIPAGVIRVPFRKFLVLALLGSAAFCFGLAAAGWALGTAYTRARHDLDYVGFAVLAGVVLVAAYFLYRWATVNRRRVADPAD